MLGLAARQAAEEKQGRFGSPNPKAQKNAQPKQYQIRTGGFGGKMMPQTQLQALNAANGIKS